jgi:DNA polymerase-3 subunit delta'
MRKYENARWRERQLIKVMQLKDVPGLIDLKKQLVLSAHNNRNGHALLFHGPSAGLSFPLVKAYSKFLACKNPEADDSCGHCNNCIQFDQNTYPDLHYSFPFAGKDKAPKNLNCDFYMREWLTFLGVNEYFALNDWLDYAQLASKSAIINVHEVRRVNEKLNYKSYSGGKKFFIIYLPEHLNISASNKLLKTLEEPSDNSMIFLISEKPETLLKTITSRCQKVFVPPLSTPLVEQFLINQGLSDENARVSASLASGSITEALQVSKSNQNYLVYANLFKNWMRGCYTAKTREIFAFVDEFAKLGRDKQREALQFFMEVIQLSLKAGGLNEKASHPLFTQIGFKLDGFASVLHFKNSKEAFEVLSEATHDIKRNGNARLIMSDVSFKFSNLLRMKP